MQNNLPHKKLFDVRWPYTANKMISNENILLSKELELQQNQFKERETTMNCVLDGIKRIKRISIHQLMNENKKMRGNINDLITCQICLEQFQSTGERIPCKLKCPHVMCKECADGWLQKVSFKWFNADK